MDAPGSIIQVNVDMSVAKPVSRELMHLNSEVSDIVGVDTALDEAMAMEDADEISSTEKSPTDSQDTTEESNKDEEKSKDRDFVGGAELHSVANPCEAGTVQMSDKETDKSEGKIFGDDKEVIYKDTQVSPLVETKYNEKENSNPVISKETTESQEEPKIPSDTVLAKPITRDIVGADAARDTVMALEDAEEVSSTEQSSDTNDSQDKREEANKREEKIKDIGCIEGAELSSVTNAGEAVTVKKSDKVTDKSEGKILGDDKKVVFKDTQASLLVENKTTETVNSNTVISKGVASEETSERQEEPKIPSPSAVEKELKTEATADKGGHVAVPDVDDKPLSQDTENQVKEEVKSDMGDNFPSAAVNGEERKPVENRSKPKAPARPIKVEPPKVQPSTSRQTLQTELVPGGKPCDRITKDMVPTMKEGRIEEVLKLSGQIEFHKGVTPLALLSKSRWLVKQGDATLVPQVNRAFSILRSFRKNTYHLFLFNDTFVICKKKGKKFIAFNYCPRNLVLITKATTVDKLPERVRTDTKGKNKVYLTMLENHEKKEESMVLSFAECSDREEWIKHFKTPAVSNQKEVVFELWDCPLVKVINDFEATKPEEMTVRKDEKINVIRKGTNGFYEGERISDQMRGYFPINVTVELSSEHTRAHQIREKHNATTF